MLIVNPVDDLRNGLVTPEILYKFVIEKYDDNKTTCRELYTSLGRISSLIRLAGVHNPGITSYFTDTTIEKISALRTNDITEYNDVISIHVDYDEAYFVNLAKGKPLKILKEPSHRTCFDASNVVSDNANQGFNKSKEEHVLVVDSKANFMSQNEDDFKRVTFSSDTVRTAIESRTFIKSTCTTMSNSSTTNHRRNGNANVEICLGINDDLFGTRNGVLSLNSNCRNVVLPDVYRFSDSYCSISTNSKESSTQPEVGVIGGNVTSMAVSSLSEKCFDNVMNDKLSNTKHSFKHKYDSDSFIENDLFKNSVSVVDSPTNCYEECVSRDHNNWLQLMHYSRDIFDHEPKCVIDTNFTYGNAVVCSPKRFDKLLSKLLRKKPLIKWPFQEPFDFTFNRSDRLSTLHAGVSETNNPVVFTSYVLTSESVDYTRAHFRVTTFSSFDRLFSNNLSTDKQRNPLSDHINMVMEIIDSTFQRSNVIDIEFKNNCTSKQSKSSIIHLENTFVYYESSRVVTTYYNSTLRDRIDKIVTTCSNNRKSVTKLPGRIYAVMTIPVYIDKSVLVK